MPSLHTLAASNAGSRLFSWNLSSITFSSSNKRGLGALIHFAPSAIACRLTLSKSIASCCLARVVIGASITVSPTTKWVSLGQYPYWLSVSQSEVDTFLVKSIVSGLYTVTANLSKVCINKSKSSSDSSMTCSGGGPTGGNVSFHAPPSIDLKYR